MQKLRLERKEKEEEIRRAEEYKQKCQGVDSNLVWCVRCRQEPVKLRRKWTTHLCYPRCKPVMYAFALVCGVQSRTNNCRSCSQRNSLKVCAAIPVELYQRCFAVHDRCEPFQKCISRFHSDSQ